jgi:hypothetical protein
VREYLAALDQAAVREDGELPGNPPSEPKATLLTDPASAWTNKGQVKVGFAYGTNYLIDLQRAIIVDVEATPARSSAEVAATKRCSSAPRTASASSRNGWRRMPPMDRG